MPQPIAAPLLDDGPGSDVLIGIAPLGDPRRRLGMASVTAIGFFCVSGGVYGCEELISAAPPLVVCVFTLGVALAFALPNALMTAELATAFPADGGAVAWVRVSFGPTLGMHHAVWVWLTSLLDAAVYPQLAALYLARFFEGSSWMANHGVVLAVVLFAAGMNLCGLDVVAASQTVAFVVAVFPCLAFTALGLPRLRPAPLLSVAGPIDGALLLSWSLWLYSGFASLGSVAGEVAQPRLTYPVVLAILLPLVTLLDLLFFMVAISLDPDAPHFTAGYFGVLAGSLAGEWLKTAFTIGAPHSQDQTPFTACIVVWGWSGGGWSGGGWSCRRLAQGNAVQPADACRVAALHTVFTHRRLFTADGAVAVHRSLHGLYIPSPDPGRPPIPGSRAHWLALRPHAATPTACISLPTTARATPHRFIDSRVVLLHTTSFTPPPSPPPPPLHRRRCRCQRLTTGSLPLSGTRSRARPACPLQRQHR